MKEKSAASNILSTSIDNMRALVDASTIIGEPIKLGSVTVIPVSKVQYGFASGGSDFPSKGNQELFGGGGGAGVTITPVAFLVESNGSVSVKYVNASESSVESLIGRVPDIVDKLTATVDKFLAKKDGGSDPVDDAVAFAEDALGADLPEAPEA
ncbi:MAG: sporulation protein YtfJ [Oscillospiraceae bacterium]|jgi:sporulation protein YtfJ|nr:sporulation protein YtfJ [Oscillospiraceae bacterium]